MIPLVHDLAGARVLVVGGGRVGARKARRFAGEADVVVVSPAFADAEFGGVERVRARVTAASAPDWVERVDPVLVVAATDDDAVNGALAGAARERGLLVNRADRSGRREPGSVVVPATVRDGDVLVAVSTSGASPALSRYLRERVESAFAGAGEMASLTAEIRAALRAMDVESSLRRDAVRAVVRSDRVWKGLRDGHPKPRREAAAVVAAVLDR